MRKIQQSIAFGKIQKYVFLGAPLLIKLKKNKSRIVLGVGSHLKHVENTVMIPEWYRTDESNAEFYLLMVWVQIGKNYL